MGHAYRVAALRYRSPYDDAAAREYVEPTLRPADVETTAPARLDDPPSAYEIQFTTTAAHVELLERARALLSHRSPTASLGELHLQAMRLLVETLEKQRYGAKLAEAAPTPKRDVRGETHAEATELVGTAEVHVPTMSGPTRNETSGGSTSSKNATAAATSPKVGFSSNE